jgi:hypothetical protein
VIAALAATSGPTVERLGWLALLLGLVAHAVLARRGARLLAFLPLPGAVVALGAIAGRVRDDAIARGVGQFPDRFVPPFVATSHASAMRATWWASVVAAVLLALPGVALSWRPGRTRTALGASAAAALLGIAAALGVGEAGWSAIPCALAAIALAGEGRVLGALALVVAATGAPIGADGAVYARAVLDDPTDLAALDPTAVGWFVAMVALAVALATAAVVLIRARSTAADVAAIGAAVAVAWGSASRDAALAHGPPERLAELALPVIAVEPPFRVASGCLVTPDGDGWRGEPIGGGECPATVAPGAFSRRAVPLVVLPQDAPVAGLAGWSGPGGTAAALVRLDDGGALPAWRVAQVPFRTWSAEEPPLRDAIVVRAGTPLEQVRAEVGGRIRADVAFAADVPLAEALRACAAVQTATIACGVGP